MAEEKEITESVRTTSDGEVKITIEKYQELQAKANEPKVFPNYTTVVKTPEMRASDNKFHGFLLMTGGASVFAIGAFQFWAGVKQTAALAASK